mmetsp:Transcript_138840/g.443246  ORF Transcript_138840/g.443246 Transcript_138840/m.443246 type:complete len:214 (-) Transcript_138840:218-859(-)
MKRCSFASRNCTSAAVAAMAPAPSRVATTASDSMELAAMPALLVDAPIVSSCCGNGPTIAAYQLTLPRKELAVPFASSMEPPRTERTCAGHSADNLPSSRSSATPLELSPSAISFMLTASACTFASSAAAPPKPASLPAPRRTATTRSSRSSVAPKAARSCAEGPSPWMLRAFGCHLCNTSGTATPAAQPANTSRAGPTPPKAGSTQAQAPQS